MLDIKRIVDPNFERINKERFQSMEFGMNQNNATVYLAIGIHMNHKDKVAHPCIVGSEYLSREQAVTLLKECIIALDEKLLKDAGR